MTRLTLARLARVLGLLALAVPHVIWLTQPYPLLAKLVHLVVLAVAIVNPVYGLLVVAALGPLAYNIAMALAVPTNIPLREEMVVAASLGALIRWRPTEPASRSGVPAFLVAAVAIASAMVLMPTRALVATTEDLTIWQHAAALWRNGLGPVWFPASSAIVLTEGMLLLWSAEILTRRDPTVAARVITFALMGYAAAGLLNINRVFAAALRGGDFLNAAPGLFLNTRYNMFYDRNAAASIFALILLAGVALWRRPAWRLTTIGALLTVMLATLWLSGSRIAVLAVCLVAAGAAAWRLAPRGRRGLIALASICAAFALAFVLYKLLYPANRSDVLSFSILGRLDMWRVALRIASSVPMFGIGIGTFAEHAVAFGSPFGAENAHNNLLQILAEEGVTGLLAGLILVTAVLVPVVRQEIREQSVVRFWLLAGIAAFGLTAMTGHPLLVPEVAWPFWMLLGIVAALSPAPARQSWRVPVVGAVVVFLAMSIPARVAHLRAPLDLEHHGFGLSVWQTDGSGLRFRTAGAKFTLFLPAGQTSVVPMRRTAAAPDPVEIEIRDGDTVLNTVKLSGLEWLPVEVSPTQRGRTFEGVDFVMVPAAPASSSAVLFDVGKAGGK